MGLSAQAPPVVLLASWFLGGAKGGSLGDAVYMPCTSDLQGNCSGCMRVQHSDGHDGCCRTSTGDGSAYAVIIYSTESVSRLAVDSSLLHACATSFVSP